MAQEAARAAEAVNGGEVNHHLIIINKKYDTKNAKHKINKKQNTKYKKNKIQKIQKIGSDRPFKDPFSWRSPPEYLSRKFPFLFRTLNMFWSYLHVCYVERKKENGNLRLRYSGGILYEAGSLNGWKLPTEKYKTKS
jgi:hypothetical protein